MGTVVIYNDCGCPPAPPAASSPCPCIGPPTFSGFQSFVVNTVGVCDAVLPSTSQVYCTAYTMATRIVNRILGCIAPEVYTFAVYNLGASNIINFAQDLPGAPGYNGSNLPFFEYLRKQWNISGYISGTIQSSSDVSTADSMVVPDYAKDLNLMELQLIKDPYGRQYLALAQNFGPLWGIS